MEKQKANLTTAQRRPNQEQITAKATKKDEKQHLQPRGMPHRGLRTMGSV